jgi:hypothetical protein
MKLRFANLAAVFAVAALASAADNPRGTASATVGGKKVSIEYGRPALKGRTVDELTNKLPEDRMWRAGENQVTILTTEGDLMVGGKKLPAGRYSLYVYAPANGEWALAINTDQGMPLGKLWSGAPENMKNEPWPHLEGYQKSIASTEVARAPMKAGKTAAAIENFTIDLKPVKDAAALTLSWGDRTWSLDMAPVK